MQTHEYQNIFKNEGTHFYYLSTHRLILHLIRKATKKRNLKILDAGCGTGLFTKKLNKFGDVFGVDIHPEAIKLAKQRNIKVKKASINKLPFKSSTFDLITTIDVLYHRSVNDRKAIQEFYRILKPGGILIIRVAAFNWLITSHDRVVHTRKRFTKNQLQELLTKNKFELNKISYVNFSLLFFVLITRFLEKIFPPRSLRSHLLSLPKSLNYLLIQLFSLENSLLDILNFPFGVGIIAVCHKPNKGNNKMIPGH